MRVSLVILLSCVWVSDQEHTDFVDADGDGYYSDAFSDGDDCDDSDAAVHPGASEACDGIDNDCDGMEDAVSCDQEGDTDTDTGTHEPVLSLLSASESSNQVNISFVASDEDDDIEGGSLDLTVGALSYSISIPDQLNSWSAGVGTVLLDFDDCDRGTSTTVTGTVLDSTGRSSGQGTDIFTPSGLSLRPSEGGDDETTAYDITDASGTLYICGNIASTSDEDWFIIDGDGLDDAYSTWSFSLTWTDTASDLDLYLMYWHNLWGWSEFASDIDHHAYQPATISYELRKAENAESYWDYYVYVAGYSGAATDYVLRVNAP